MNLRIWLFDLFIFRSILFRLYMCLQWYPRSQKDLFPMPRLSLRFNRSSHQSFRIFCPSLQEKKRNQKYWSQSHKPTHSKRTRMFFVRSHSRNQRKNRKYQYFRHGSPSKRRFQIALKFGEKSGDKCSTNITKFVQIGSGKVFWNVGQSWEECAACWYAVIGACDDGNDSWNKVRK